MCVHLLSVRQFSRDNNYLMVTNAEKWRSSGLLWPGDARLLGAAAGRRRAARLVEGAVARPPARGAARPRRRRGRRSVGELARELGLSLPAASTLARELEEHGLIARREDPADRRRTVVEPAPATEQAVRGWLARAVAPTRAGARGADPGRTGGVPEGTRRARRRGDGRIDHGPLRPHHRKAHRRRSHRDRPV